MRLSCSWRFCIASGPSSTSVGTRVKRLPSKRRSWKKCRNHVSKRCWETIDQPKNAGKILGRLMCQAVFFSSYSISWEEEEESWRVRNNKCHQIPKRGKICQRRRRIEVGGGKRRRKCQKRFFPPKHFFFPRFTRWKVKGENEMPSIPTRSLLCWLSGNGGEIRMHFPNQIYALFY